MNILVIGGTRFFGIHMVDELLKRGHEVTIATRGLAKDHFGDKVKRIIIDRSNEQSVIKALGGKFYDVICDNIAFCSNDVKYLLDTVPCNRYVMTSTMSVYDLHMEMKEEDFNPLTYEFKWCGREDYPYGEIKRQAECALYQHFKNVESTAVRFPFVIGVDDYTKRLLFYVEHIVKEIPMYVDNLKEQLAFVDSEEAGRFLAFMAESDYTGSINGCSSGTITLEQIFNYIEVKTGKKAILKQEGEKASYNGANSYSVNIEKSKKTGYVFINLEQWIYDLLDRYIEMAKKK